CLEKDPRKRLRDIGDAFKLVDEDVPSSRARQGAGQRLWQAAALTLVIALAVLWWTTRRSAPETLWSGEWLGGSSIAFDPRISPDGQTLAFEAMVDSTTQVAVMKPDSGNWQVLTRDRTHGYATELSWSPDGAKVYFTRYQDGPRGIYSVPVFGGE